VSVATDRANCGACGNACAASATCVGGACSCATTTCNTGFSGSGSFGDSGFTCLRTYTFNVVAGRTYTISTCGSYSGDPYLAVSGACSCSNDDACALGSSCTCTATATGIARLCASSFGSASATWNYTVTSTNGGCCR
jgi:hypothetical protein